MAESAAGNHGPANGLREHGLTRKGAHRPKTQRNAVLRFLDEVASGETWPDKLLCLSGILSAAIIGWHLVT